jgi:hypothetical protein
VAARPRRWIWPIGAPATMDRASGGGAPATIDLARRRACHESI